VTGKLLPSGRGGITTFEDLISQKILLERFASASWFITAAMQ
jgi:hypothetical protein